MRTALLVLAGLLAGCSAPQGGDEPAADALAALPDVHGLAVDPARHDALLVATHQGLARYEDGRWTRASREPLDLMGFAQHPTDASVAWASGHPPTGGALGIVKSTDGGATWRPLALPGKDFHALAVSPADPQRLWGYAAGALHRSEDGGATWREVGALPPVLRALHGHREARDTLLGTTPAGIARSDDAGATWRTVSPLPAYAVAVAADGAWFAGAADGVHRSTDEGASWTRVGGPPGAVLYVAAHPADAGVAYAATANAGVYRSADRGASWDALMPPSR